MKIKELIQNTPEVSEEKLLEYIDNELPFLQKINKGLVNRILHIHGYSDSTNKLILKEYDIIQDKKSYLTTSQRNLITGFVGTCMIKMVKADGSGSEDTVGNIPEVEDSRDDSNIGE